jgi:tetraacyldisaccharide 4'-kinase
MVEASHLSVRLAMETALNRIWYGDSLWRYLLMPPSLAYCAGVRLRAALYDSGVFRRQRFSVPVLIVGNLVAGGSGKTPLVCFLADGLRGEGYRVGICVSGYRGSARHWPRSVDADADPQEVGDEAVLLARRTGAPVCAGPDRVRAVQCLVDAGCDLVICDDGLQHERLGRDLEILVVDARTGFGNGLCLPAGPLREPASRARRVDLVVANAGAWPGAFAMALEPAGVFPVSGQGGPGSLSEFAGREVHAVAGIARPARFFELLESAGVGVTAHAFADHHRFVAGDLDFGDDRPVLMTEKDAVKCRLFARPADWFVRADARLPAEFMRQVLNELNA